MIYVTNTGSGTVPIVDGKVDGTIERLNFNFGFGDKVKSASCCKTVIIQQH
jgi:hypothetical protein